MVVACQNLINLFENAFFLFKPHIPYGYVHLFAFLPELLSCCSVLYSEFSISTLRAIMREPKKVKCFWLLIVPRKIVFCKTPKVNQPSFALFQGQAEMSHTLLQ